MAGHLGRRKTADRILQRFYWPGWRRDVVEYCRTCEACQKTADRERARLILLAIIEEPFSRLAIDIVGPLVRTRTGRKYILVINDYATRYPEAIPLRSIKADRVAGELVKLFSIPKEILTDQRSIRTFEGVL